LRPLRGREGLGWGRGGKWEGKGSKGEVEGREREGPKLLLNQGPSEPCYAIAVRHLEFSKFGILVI